jgi:hypothetical protein
VTPEQLAEKIRAADARRRQSFGERVATLPGALAQIVRGPTSETAPIGEGAYTGNVATGSELADYLARVRTTVGLGNSEHQEDVSARVIVTKKQAGANVASLLRVVPTTRELVRSSDISAWSGAAGAADNGVSLPSLSGATVSTDQERLTRYGVAADLAVSSVRDPGNLSATVDSIMQGNFVAGLANDALNANGSTFGTGFLHAPSLPSIDATAAGDLADEIAAAVQTVREANQMGSVSVVAAPATLRLLRRDSGQVNNLALEDYVPDVDQWVSSPSMPAGQALVGDLWSAGVLWVSANDGLNVAVSDSHNSNFLSALATLRLTTRLRFFVVDVTALCLVHDIGS